MRYCLATEMLMLWPVYAPEPVYFKEIFVYTSTYFVSNVKKLGYEQT